MLGKGQAGTGRCEECGAAFLHAGSPWMAERLIINSCKGKSHFWPETRYGSFQHQGQLSQNVLYGVLFENSNQYNICLKDPLLL